MAVRFFVHCLDFIEIVTMATFMAAHNAPISRPPPPPPTAVQLDTTTLAPGQSIEVKWNHQPIVVWNRTPAQINHQHQSLIDPTSVTEQQPPYAQNNLRARNHILVVSTQCPHMGCAVIVRPKEWDKPIPTGFFCPCRGGYYDSSGRLLNGGVHATNLAVPPHHFRGSTLIIGRHVTKQIGLNE